MAGDISNGNRTALEHRKPRQGRSPAFPFISIGKALERAESFRVAEGGRPKHFTPIAAACKAWGIGVKTGTAIQTVAALGHYGLFDFEGSAEGRSAKLTEMALRILLDKKPISPERDELIKRAALTPAVHAELWKNWEASLPSDATLETYLVRDRGFSESGAQDLIAEYKETIAFAKLDQSAGISAEPSVGGTEAKAQEVKIGDLIQAEINGVLAFQAPKRVRAIREHDGKRWVFVDGHETGFAMDQAQLIERSPKNPIEPPKLPFETFQEQDWLEERLLDEKGEEIFLKYKGEPTKDRYEFIRDYLDFKIKRMSKLATSSPSAPEGKE